MALQVVEVVEDVEVIDDYIWIARHLRHWTMTRSSGVLRAQTRRAILNHMVQYPLHMDRTFAAISDPTRRGILHRRDGMLQSGMEEGLNQSYDALDRLLATLD